MMPQEPMTPEPLALRAGPQPPEDKTPPPLSLRDEKNFPCAEATTVASRDKDEGSATSAATPFSIPTSPRTPLLNKVVVSPPSSRVTTPNKGIWLFETPSPQLGYQMMPPPPVVDLAQI